MARTRIYQVSHLSCTLFASESTFDEFRFTKYGLVVCFYAFSERQTAHIFPKIAPRNSHGLVLKSDITPVMIHGLKHKYITHFLQNGIHTRIANEGAGHARIAVTMDIYAHAIPDMQRGAAARIDALVCREPSD